MEEAQSVHICFLSFSLKGRKYSWLWTLYVVVKWISLRKQASSHGLTMILTRTTVVASLLQLLWESLTWSSLLQPNLYGLLVKCILRQHYFRYFHSPELSSSGLLRKQKRLDIVWKLKLPAYGFTDSRRLPHLASDRELIKSFGLTSSTLDYTLSSSLNTRRLLRLYSCSASRRLYLHRNTVNGGSPRTFSVKQF